MADEPLDNPTLAALWRQGWLIAGMAVLGAGLALVWALGVATPTYVSRTEVLVRPVVSPAFEPAGSGTGLNLGHERELVHSGAVAGLVHRRLDSQESVADVRSRVGVSVVGSTGILDLTYRAPSRNEAQRGANAYAAAYLELKRRQVEAVRGQRRVAIESALDPIEEELSQARRDLGRVAPGTGPGLAAQARVDDLTGQAAPYHENLAESEVVDPGDVGAVVSRASRPGAPVRPRPLLDGLLGTVIGLGAGVALALGRARVDRRLRGRADLEEHLGAPVLATVPRLRRSRRGAPALVTVEQPDSRASDAYRALWIRMLAPARTRPLKTVLVTSAAGDSGATAVAANLAESLTRAGKEVALVSAGPAGSDDLLQPDVMRGLLAERGEGADIVVVEAPPMLDTAEGLALAPLVDGVVVVAAVGSTNRDDVALVRHQLDQVGAEVVGGVLSNARTAGPI
jgi:succinoglycan biosynthesis transport protein ExoP